MSDLESVVLKANNNQWVSTDAHALYTELVQDAATASSDAQQQVHNPNQYSSLTLSRDEIMQKVAEVARAIGSKLNSIVDELGASGCAVTVSAWPPTIQLTVSWDAPKR
jgi:hypothetical protein